MSRTLVLESCRICDASRRTRKSISGDTWYASCTLSTDSTFVIFVNHAIQQVAYARCHLDWARKNLETWTEAKDEVDKIVAR